MTDKKIINDNKHQRGAIILGTTIIVLAAALLIAISVQYLGIGELLLSFASQQSDQSSTISDSCVNESLLQLKRNNAWNGGTLNLGGGTCTVVVTGSDSAKTISISSTVGQSVRKTIVTATVSGTNVTVTSWVQDNS